MLWIEIALQRINHTKFVIAMTLAQADGEQGKKFAFFWILSINAVEAMEGKQNLSLMVIFRPSLVHKSLSKTMVVSSWRKSFWPIRTLFYFKKKWNGTQTASLTKHPSITKHILIISRRWHYFRDHISYGLIFQMKLHWNKETCLAYCKTLTFIFSFSISLTPISAMLLGIVATLFMKFF